VLVVELVVGVGVEEDALECLCVGARARVRGVNGEQRERERQRKEVRPHEPMIGRVGESVNRPVTWCIKLQRPAGQRESHEAISARIVTHRRSPHHHTTRLTNLPGPAPWRLAHEPSG
jgi:hypothetical protein